MKNIFLVVFSTFLVLQIGSAQNKKPNIVVVMADDIGLGDVSYYHTKRTNKAAVIETPNIDELIQNGIRFSDAHSPAALCAPTRFSMMTGNYSYRNSSPNGVWSATSDALIEPNFTTVARIAKAGGYATAFFGKWGLGGVWNSKQADFTKVDKGAPYYGFDYSLMLPQGIQNHPYAFYENGTWMKLKPNSILKELPHSQTGYAENDKKHGGRGGLGDSNWDPTLAGPILAEKAVDYIENQSKLKEPFFLYYCSQAVHVPHTPSKMLDNQKVAGSAPGNHGDMIKELDVQVGMMVKALKKAGIYDNTLFIFTSDNGGLAIDKAMTKAGHDSSNGLEGHKGSISEGGHRVPFVAVWPGKIKPNIESNEPIVGLDVVATVAALANQKMDRTKVKDSENLVPFFLGTAKKPVHTYVINRSQNGPSYALRDKEWKLIVSEGGKGNKKLQKLNKNKAVEYSIVGLFNLKDNLNEDETQNLKDSPEQKVRLDAMFLKFKELMKTGEQTATSIN